MLPAGFAVGFAAWLAAAAAASPVTAAAAAAAAAGASLGAAAGTAAGVAGGAALGAAPAASGVWSTPEPKRGAAAATAPAAAGGAGAGVAAEDGALPLAGRQVVPGPVAAQRQDQPDQQDPPAGHAALAERHRQSEIRADLHLAGFRLVAVEDALGVKPEIMRIGADEPDDIGRPRQVGGAPLLDRDQVDGLDAQRLADRFEVEAEFAALFAEQVADGVRTLRLARPVFRRVAERFRYPLKQAHAHSRRRLSLMQPHHAVQFPLLLAARLLRRRACRNDKPLRATANRATPFHRALPRAIESCTLVTA